MSFIVMNVWAAYMINAFVFVNLSRIDRLWRLQCLTCFINFDCVEWSLTQYHVLSTTQHTQIFKMKKKMKTILKDFQVLNIN
jgi:hypothetical protein